MCLDMATIVLMLETDLTEVRKSASDAPDEIDLMKVCFGLHSCTWCDALTNVLYQHN